MNRGRARYSYSAHDYPVHDHPCPCSRRRREEEEVVVAPPPPPAAGVGSAFDSLDLKQMLLFAGVGVLFVIAMDTVVRLVAAREKKAGTITIDGRAYMPV